MKTYSYQALLDFIDRLFVAMGTPADLASLMAKSLVGSNLCGHDSHGVQLALVYAQAVNSGQVAQAARASVTPNAPMLATLTVDAALGWGPPAGYFTCDRLIERANAYGVAAAVIQRCHHIGRVGQYAEYFAAAGVIGISMCNSGSGVAPFGGKTRMLGTNPITIGVPRANGQAPVMIDASTSVVAGNKLSVLLDKGLPTPANWIINADGQASTDPADFLQRGGALLPSGGHKGYGLALLVDMFAGLLSNAAYLTHVKSWVDAPDEPQNLGHFFILIDTRLLGSAQWLSERMLDFAAILHDSPAVDATRPVIVPGEIELKKMAYQRANGIVLDEATVSLLLRHASA